MENEKWIRVTIDIKLRGNLTEERIHNFIQEMDYNFISHTEGVTSGDTTIYDFEELVN